MSFDREKQVGELLDRALADHRDLYFQPAWHPRQLLARRRRRWRYGWGTGAVAAAIFLTLPFTVHPSQGHRQVTNDTLSAIRLPKPLNRSISQVARGSYAVASMVPVYGTYPLVSATGHNLWLSGSFVLGRQSGNALSLLLNNHMNVAGGMLFHSGVPVYAFSGPALNGGNAIQSPKASPVPMTGKDHARWYPQGDVGIGSFSAAGSHVYVTHGNLWSDVVPYTNDYWMQSPANPKTTTVDTIAGLPASPNTALLMEDNSAGLSRGFITTDGGTTWQPWGLGSQAVSTLIAIRNRYWAILNGTLSWSANGRQWNNILPLNPKRWQVETYALDPADPNVAAVSLIPIAGDGIGPVLETTNGGKSWSEVPNFPAIGESPTTMVMNSNGNIAALINANGPVVVRYTASSQHWSVLPVPSSGNRGNGLGQLAASANGNLIYGAPGGVLYQWIHQSGKWFVINPPAGYDNAGLAASPLQTVGNNQILAGYPSGWAIFWEPPAIAAGQNTAPQVTRRAQAARLRSAPATPVP